MTFMDASWLGQQAINNMEANNLYNFNNSMANSWANSSAITGANSYNPATSPNTDPYSGMTYPGAGMVQPYPSFGEAIYPGYGPRGGYGTGTPSTAEQPFSPSGGAGGYNPASNAGPSWWGGNNYPDIQGQVPPFDPSSGLNSQEWANQYRGGGGAGGTWGMNDMGQPPDYGAPTPPPQTYNPYGNWQNRWEDSGGQYAPPAARPGSGPDGGWGRYFDDVTQGAPAFDPSSGLNSQEWADRYRGWGGPGSLPGDIGSSPMSKPMPNQGYNPGMENSFANPAMRQVDPGTWGNANDWQKLLNDIDRVNPWQPSQGSMPSFDPSSGLNSQEWQQKYGGGNALRDQFARQMAQSAYPQYDQRGYPIPSTPSGLDRPLFQIDPNTRQPMLGPNGQPIPDRDPLISPDIQRDPRLLMSSNDTTPYQPGG